VLEANRQSLATSKPGTNIEGTPSSGESRRSKTAVKSMARNPASSGRYTLTINKRNLSALYIAQFPALNSAYNAMPLHAY